MPESENDESAEVPEASVTDRLSAAPVLVAVTGEVASPDCRLVTSALPAAEPAAVPDVLRSALPVPRVSVVPLSVRLLAEDMPVAEACCVLPATAAVASLVVLAIVSVARPLVRVALTAVAALS